MSGEGIVSSTDHECELQMNYLRPFALTNSVGEDVIITYLATVYTKGNWFDNPFVIAILGTKFLTTCV